MTGDRLKALIYMGFGGNGIAQGYFSTTGADNDLDSAIAAAIDEVLLNMSPNADQGDYSIQTIAAGTGDGATEAFALDDAVLRPLHVFINDYEVCPVKSRDFRRIVGAYINAESDSVDDTWYACITGRNIRIFPYLSSTDVVKIYYVAKCDEDLTSLDDELAKVPLPYQNAVVAYAQFLLSHKAKGQWPGDPLIFQKEYLMAMSEGHRLSSEGFRDGIYPMQASNWAFEEL